MALLNDPPKMPTVPETTAKYTKAADDLAKARDQVKSATRELEYAKNSLAVNERAAAEAWDALQAANARLFAAPA